MQKTAQILQEGFTMVELLVVVSIIAIMTGALIPSFAGYTKNQALRQAQEMVVNDLYTVQNNALAGKKAFDGTTTNFWGLRFNNGGGVAQNEYEYVTGSTGSTSTDCSNAVSQKKVSLGDDIKVKGTMGSPKCVFFSLANGDSGNTSGDVIVQVQRINGGTACYEITTNKYGLIIRKQDINLTCP